MNCTHRTITLALLHFAGYVTPPLQIVILVLVFVVTQSEDSLLSSDYGQDSFVHILSQR